MGLLESAEKLHDQMWSEATHGNWHTGEFNEVVLPEPTFADKQRIAITIGILIDKHEVLERVDATDEDTLRGALRTIGDAIRENAAEYEAQQA